MLNCFGLSDIVLQCDLEPSLIKWSEGEKSKRQERTVIQSSPRRSHQSNGAVENYQKQLQGPVRTTVAALQDRTQYRPTTDSALMKRVVRHAAWLIPRFRRNDVQSPFYRAMGAPYRGKLLEFGDSVFAPPSRGGKRIWDSRAERSWLRDGNPPCGWARATSQTSIGSELTKGLNTCEACDGSPSTACQKKTSVQLSKHNRSRTRRQRTSHLPLNFSLFLMHHKKYPKMRRRNPQQN